MDNDELKEKLVKDYFEACDDQSWEEMTTSGVNLDGADEKTVMLQAWWRPGATSTSMYLKINLQFPLWDVKTLWDLTKDIDERLKWDDRAIEPEVLESSETDNYKIFTMKTPKPPVPLVAQREIVAKMFRIDNYKNQDENILVGCSVDHPARPVGEGYWDYVRGIAYMTGIRIQAAPDGKGVIMTECRHMDVQGQFPEVVVGQIANWVPTLSFNGWDAKYKSMIN